MERLYYEKHTDLCYPSLLQAKRAALKLGRRGKISRIWIEGEKVLGMCLVYAFGSRVCTVAEADEVISRKLNIYSHEQEEAN